MTCRIDITNCRKIGETAFKHDLYSQPISLADKWLLCFSDHSGIQKEIFNEDSSAKDSRFAFLLKTVLVKFKIPFLA